MKLITCVVRRAAKVMVRRSYATVSTYEAEYRRSIDRPEEYWAEKKDLIQWHKQPDRILDNTSTGRWYSGGEVNASYNCLDVHVNEGRGDQTAVIHDSPVTDTQEKLTFKSLRDEVALFAGVLAKHGVQKGDRVLIYMPMIPQTIVAMLASARIGAIHSLVFGGFAPKELSSRINHAKPKIIVSTNFGIEPGRQINYKNLVDQAIQFSDYKPFKCIYYNRPMFPKACLKNDRVMNLNYEHEIESVLAHDCVPVDANHPLYILYTSGTTGNPKGVVRPTGGYLVALKDSMRTIYGMNPGEVWWAASDFGWVVGHSYACYAPLLAGNTTIIYEGKPVGTPDAGAIFRVMSEHSVSVAFLAPTVLRAIIQQDPLGKFAKKYNLDKMRYLFLAGEKCDKTTLEWAQGMLRRPVFDHWWQTETGWPITSMCAGLMSNQELENTPVGVSGKAVPGYNVRILNEHRDELGHREPGRIVIKLPLPPGNLTTLWENEELFKKVYLTDYPGYYDTADVGNKCENGFMTVTSRADDVINVAGHRISSSALEEAILVHNELSECAVVELQDDLKGAVPFGFLVKKKNSETGEEKLLKEVVSVVRSSIGPVAAFKNAVFVDKLPKTRSGKISRSSLKDMVNNKTFKVPVTVEDPNVYNQIRLALTSQGFKKVGTPI